MRFLPLLLLLSGCVVTPTSYHKEIVVRKDGDGKIVETIQTEWVTQPDAYGHPIQFDHLKGIGMEPAQKAQSPGGAKK